ncbi:hypothetical protein HDU88_004566 [Geranomyces variabilis]|nr:hypothetical protein HDU88_004566 [Geranomyces variabilis]
MSRYHRTDMTSSNSPKHKPGLGLPPPTPPPVPPPPSRAGEGTEVGRGGPGAGPRPQVVVAGSSSNVTPMMFCDEDDDDDEDDELLMDPRSLLSSRLKQQSKAQHQQPEPATAQPKRRKLIRKVDRAKVDPAKTPAELPEQDEGPFWASDSENQPKVKVTAEPKRRKLIKKKSRAKDVDSAEVSARPSDPGVAPPQDNFEDQVDFVTGLDEVNDDEHHDEEDGAYEDDSHEDGSEARWIAVHASLLPIGCPPGRYEISSLGNVKSNTMRSKGELLRKSLDKAADRYKFGFSYAGRKSVVSVARAVLISFEGMPEDPEMTVDHIDGDRKNDVLANLQFLPWLENYRKGGDDQAAAKIYTDVDLTTAPAVDAQDWKQHPRLPHIECSRQGWLRKTGSRKLLRLQAGYYGHRHARVAGVVPWLAVHRAVYETWVGEIPPGMIVHHVAGDRTDNTPESLQLATPAENARWGRVFSAINTSRATGVCWHKKAGKWMAFINAGGVLRYLGLSADKDVAIALRRKAEIALDYRPVNPVGNPDLVPNADPTTSVKKKHNLPKYIYEMGGGRLHVSLHWQKKNYTIGTCYDLQEAIVMKERAIREYDFVPGVRMGRLDELKKMAKARQAHRHRRPEHSLLSGVNFRPAMRLLDKKAGLYKNHKAVWVAIAAGGEYVGRYETQEEAEEAMRDHCFKNGLEIRMKSAGQLAPASEESE